MAIEEIRLLRIETRRGWAELYEVVNVTAQRQVRINPDEAGDTKERTVYDGNRLAYIVRGTMPVRIDDADGFSRRVDPTVNGVRFNHAGQRGDRSVSYGIGELD